MKDAGEPNDSQLLLSAELNRGGGYSTRTAGSDILVPENSAPTGDWLSLWQSVSRGSLINRLYTDRLIASGLAHLNLREGDSVLDLGCGRGSKTDALRLLGVDPVGIDLDPDAIRQAREDFPKTRFQVGDVHALPFADNTFDALFSLSVLQYVDREAVLKECHRVLKPGGRAVFVEHLGRNPFVRAYRVARKVCRWEYAPYLTPRGYIDVHKHGEFENLFAKTQVRAFHLTTPLALGVAVLKRHFSGRDLSVRSGRLIKVLERCDTFLMKRAEWLSCYCWFVLVTVIK